MQSICFLKNPGMLLPSRLSARRLCRCAAILSHFSEKTLPWSVSFCFRGREGLLSQLCEMAKFHITCTQKTFRKLKATQKNCVCFQMCGSFDQNCHAPCKSLKRYLIEIKYAFFANILQDFCVYTIFTVLFESVWYSLHSVHDPFIARHALTAKLSKQLFKWMFSALQNLQCNALVSRFIQETQHVTLNIALEVMNWIQSLLA